MAAEPDEGGGAQGGVQREFHCASRDAGTVARTEFLVEVGKPGVLREMAQSSGMSDEGSTELETDQAPLTPAAIACL